MKNWNQTTEQIAEIIATGRPLQIVSGEGDIGTAQKYNGSKSVRAIKARLTRERCGGDRWARVDTDDGMALAGVI
jgi:hypothetical protein